MNEMVKEKYKYSELTGKIIACAMEVHKILGSGFQELIYQRSLEEEFLLQGIEAKREFETLVYYKEKLVGTRRVDFLVEDVISLELKAVSKLDNVHLAQGINYLEAYNLEIGLLINFGAKELEFKRLTNHKFNPNKTSTAVLIHMQ